MPFMNSHSLCAAAVMCAAAGSSAAMAQDGYVYGPAHHCRNGASGLSVVQTGYGIDLDDDPERCASGIERFCLDIRDCVRETQLRGYKRLQRMHRKLLYPECPPYFSPTFGHYHTQWRPFPDNCEYVWTTMPGTPGWPAPAAPPAMLPNQTPTPAPLDQFQSPPPANGLPRPYLDEPLPQVPPAPPVSPPFEPVEPPAPVPDVSFLPFAPSPPAEVAIEAQPPALLRIE